MDEKKLEKIIAKSLNDFYKRRINRLDTLNLKKVLKRKNPYLFRSMGIEKASEIVETILSAYISSSDETIFGNAFFEPIACEVSGGKVSDAEGVDFTIEQEGKYTAVSMKSGPNPFNSSQKKKQNEQFTALKQRLYKILKQFDPILGHGYGKLDKTASGKQIYRDVSGQKLWTELTGDPSFYLKLIRLMKDVPQKHKPEYQRAWDSAINKFTREFINDFCFENGSIDWDKFTVLVSEDKRQKDAKLPI